VKSGGADVHETAKRLGTTEVVNTLICGHAFKGLHFRAELNKLYYMETEL
jgi:hypothetical protein